MILRQFLHTEPVLRTDGARADERWFVLTGHCGRGLSGKPTSTIGFERRFNRAFALDYEDGFVRRMLDDIPPRPPRADLIRAENLGKRAPSADAA